MAEQSVKSKEERLKESIRILTQIKELGINQNDIGYKELSVKFSEWVKGGEAWQGTIDFYRYNRRARVLLPTKSGLYAKCDLLIYKFIDEE
jgi:hypothetical protein